MKKNRILMSILVMVLLVSAALPGAVMAEAVTGTTAKAADLRITDFVKYTGIFWDGMEAIPTDTDDEGKPIPMAYWLLPKGEANLTKNEEGIHFKTKGFLNYREGGGPGGLYKIPVDIENGFTVTFTINESLLNGSTYESHSQVGMTETAWVLSLTDRPSPIQRSAKDFNTAPIGFQFYGKMNNDTATRVFPTVHYYKEGETHVNEPENGVGQSQINVDGTLRGAPHTFSGRFNKEAGAWEFMLDGKIINKPGPHASNPNTTGFPYETIPLSAFEGGRAYLYFGMINWKNPTGVYQEFTIHEINGLKPLDSGFVETFRLKGVLKDENGKPVANKELMLESAVQYARTNAAGEFEFTKVVYGKNTLSIINEQGNKEKSMVVNFVAGNDTNVNGDIIYINTDASNVFMAVEAGVSEMKVSLITDDMTNFNLAGVLTDKGGKGLRNMEIMLEPALRHVKVDYSGKFVLNAVAYGTHKVSVLDTFGDTVASVDLTVVRGAEISYSNGTLTVPKGETADLKYILDGDRLVIEGIASVSDADTGNAEIINTNKDTSPKTGDSFNIALIAAMLLALGALGFIHRKARA